MTNQITNNKSVEIISNIYSYDIIVYLFWIIIFISFLKIIFSENSDEYFKKIIWWLSILVFALTSKNDFIIWISIFIWWLLIATENFLIHLAWIFSNKKWDDLFWIIKSFSWKNNTIEEEKVTEEEKIKEIKEEEEEKWEKEELINETKKDKTNNFLKNSLLSNYSDTFQKQNKILDTFEEQFKSNLTDFKKHLNNLNDFKIERDIRIKNKYWSIILDWIVKNKNNHILWLEVKILRGSSHLSLYIRRYIERIRYMKFNFPFVLIIWTEKFDLIELNKIKDIFWEFDDISILFFEYWKDINSWKFLNEFDFSTIFEENDNLWYWTIINVDWDLITIQFNNWKIKTINRNGLFQWIK